MNPKKLPSGKLLVSQPVDLPDNGGVADLMMEIGPENPDYNKWLLWMERFMPEDVDEPEQRPS